MPAGMHCEYRRLVTLVLFLVLLATPAQSAPRGDFPLPALRAPEVYGDVMIDHFSTEKKVTPVVFSHWVHRPNYTCRVCHSELGFVMKANETGIVCNNGTMKEGYCFECHNGKTVDGITAFAPTGPEGDNCKRCHNAFASPNLKKFTQLKDKLPASKFGDEIDWVKALAEGKIKPKTSLSKNTPPLTLDRTLTLQAEMLGIPPAVFSHKIHTQQLDCSNCHPEIFNIKKKTTVHFSMTRILKNEFCGVCHLRITFPLNDCKRCHPGMK